MKLVIGLTGGIGSGKSTVLCFFKRLGVVTIDSDSIVKSLFKKRIIIRKVSKLFDEQILNGKKINFDKLSAIVFSNKTKLKKLEKIIHPHVFKEIEKSIKKISKNKIIVIEMPLLFESGFYKKTCLNISVTCSLPERINRAKKFSKKEVLRRSKFQLSDQKRRSLSDVVIDNSKSLSFTKRQVKFIVLFLKSIVH